MVSFDFAVRTSKQRFPWRTGHVPFPHGGHPLRHIVVDSTMGQMRVKAALAAIHAIEGHHLQALAAGNSIPGASA